MNQFPTGSGDSSASLAENVTRTSACSQEVLLALRGLFMFIPVNRSSALYCKDAVTDMLFSSYAPHINPDKPVWYQSGYTDGNKRLLCVFTITKRVWQAEASSKEKMPVSWAKCSAVKLLRSFHRMAEPTSTGAKFKTNWKHVSAHGGQMSVNDQWNCSSLW